MIRTSSRADDEMGIFSFICGTYVNDIKFPQKRKLERQPEQILLCIVKISHIIPERYLLSHLSALCTAHNDHKRTFNIEIKHNDVSCIKVRLLYFAAIVAN